MHMDNIMADYLRREADKKQLVAGVAAQNRQAIFDAMKAAGAGSIVVDFNGYGDSGSIEGVHAYKEALQDPDDRYLGSIKPTEVDLDAAGEITQVMFDYDYKTKEHTRVEVTKPMQEAIENFCYDQMETHHAGWENNAGAFGTFLFNAEEGTINYVHNTRIESHDTDAYEL